MITCVVDYVIDPKKIDVFEQFAKRWIDLVNRYGGRHHGYFLPSEGASDRALALFSFPSLADYETYRRHFGVKTSAQTRACNACCWADHRPILRAALVIPSQDFTLTGGVCR
jgi:hypothetical protein